MLKPYMGYSRYLGSNEGAVLIFAHTAKEARVLMYRDWSNIISDGWLDTAVCLLHNRLLYEYADSDKILLDKPHIIDNPPSCRICYQWGYKLNEDDVCEVCLEERGDRND